MFSDEGNGDSHLFNRTDSTLHQIWWLSLFVPGGERGGIYVRLRHNGWHNGCGRGGDSGGIGILLS